MNIVLIVMLFILFFLTLQGWRKGILGIVYGLVSWIFIFIFVSVANPYILGYLKTETNIYDKVYEQAEKFVTNKAENLPQDTGLEDWYQSLTDRRMILQSRNLAGHPVSCNYRMARRPLDK